MCVWILLYLWSKAILTDSKIFLSGFVLLTDIWPTFTCTGVYPIGGTSSYTDVDNDSIAGSSLGGSTMELLQARKNPRGIPGKWNGYLAEEIFGILYSLIFMQCAKYFLLLKFCLLILIVEKTFFYWNIFSCHEFKNCNNKIEVPTGVLESKCKNVHPQNKPIMYRNRFLIDCFTAHNFTPSSS